MITFFKRKYREYLISKVLKYINYGPSSDLQYIIDKINSGEIVRVTHGLETEPDMFIVAYTMGKGHITVKTDLKRVIVTSSKNLNVTNDDFVSTDLRILTAMTVAYVIVEKEKRRVLKNKLGGGYDLLVNKSKKYVK